VVLAPPPWYTEPRYSLLGLQAEALDLPIVLIGTVEDICDRFCERRERWGFNNIVIPDDTIETFPPVVARLAGT
jgi:hypothetical protein